MKWEKMSPEQKRNRAAYQRRWRARKLAPMRDQILAKRKKARELSRQRRRIYQKAWRVENAERKRNSDKAWYIANRERHLANGKAWVLANKERAAAKNKEWKIANPEKTRAYRKAWALANPEKVAAKNKAYQLKNKEKISAKGKAWRRANREKDRDNKKAWRLENPARYRATENARRRVRCLEDSGYAIRNRLRARLAAALKGVGKSGSSSDLLGCSILELRAHLESQFKTGMSWDNRGDWEIDHIRPVASFDMTQPEQQRQCFHYTNLQPLWVADNRRKGGKWPLVS